MLHDPKLCSLEVEMLVAVFITAFGSHIAREGDSELWPAEVAAVIPSWPTAVRCTVGRAE